MPQQPSIALELPSRVGDSALRALFAFARAAREAEGTIEIDAQHTSWIDPYGMAVLAASISPLITAGQRVDVYWLNTDLASYLARMDFFQHCTVGGAVVPDRMRNDQRRNLVELTCVDRLQDAETVASELADAMTGKLFEADPNEPPDERTGMNRFDICGYPLRYVLKELLQNSLTHARREGRQVAKVWVASQYYPKNDQVKLAIVDNGCGLLATLKDHPQLGSKTHQGAILAALTPKVSCNRGFGRFLESENQGIGLTTAARIASAAGGSLRIVTGNGFHSTRGMTGTLGPAAFWHGCAVSFSCRRDALPAVNVQKLLPTQDAPHVPVRYED